MTESHRRCGTCRHFRLWADRLANRFGLTYGDAGWGTCVAPVPMWVDSRQYKKQRNGMSDNDLADECESYQRIEAGVPEPAVLSARTAL